MRNVGFLGLTFQGFRQLRNLDRQQASPCHVVEGVGANHLVFREQALPLGVAAAGIQRPLVFPYLLGHPDYERLARVSLERSVAVGSVGLVDRCSLLWGVARGFPLVALAGRCASFQFVCNGAWSAANLSGDSTDTEALVPESLDSAPVFHSKMLSLVL